MNSEGYSFTDFPDDNANFITEYNDSSSCDSSESVRSSGNNSGIVHNSSRQGDFSSVIAIHSDKQSEQVSKNKRNWAELPSPAIENIYSFLCRTDQSRMSLVCSRWAKDFNSPSLWKTIKFHLPENDYSTEIYPEVRFARKYAFMFRHVEIIFKRIRAHLIDVIWKQLKLFLEAMEFSSQLHSIKFINMGNYFHYLDDIIYEDLFKTIINFFQLSKESQSSCFPLPFQQRRELGTSESNI
ncbi:hypothetical protein HNY73_021892 [Argiope bruennichi]|uniref:F-box domain-containing protein n=1 Tax=Argiope bruennichi TaxID=94029 RepID=A0A8T0E048_ARGBR|nr:hypothetical protein HNY73_021892 [Argiope bruennichi]